MRLIGNVEKDAQVRAVASGALPSGDAVVVNADGTVSVVEVSDTSAGTPVVFLSATLGDFFCTYDSDSQKVIIAYRDSDNSGYGTAIVGTVSGTSISFGSPVVFESDNTSQTAIAYDSNAQKVVIAYEDAGNSGYGTAIVGAVSGTSISFGSPVVFATANLNFGLSMVYDTTTQKVVIVYPDGSNSGYGTAIVGTVSGTSISFGSAVVFSSLSTGHISAVYDLSAERVVLSWRSFGNSSYGTAIVGTVSGTSISFGSAVVFNAANTPVCSSAYDSNAQKVVIAYRNYGNIQGAAIVGTVSGTSISFGTPAVFSATDISAVSASYDSDGGIVLISFVDTDNSSYGTFVYATVSGTTVSFGSAVVFDSTSVSAIESVYDAATKKMVLAYRDTGSSSYGTSVVIQSAGTNLTSENFLGFAAHTYADTQSALVNSTCTVDRNQTSLTAGQTYYVQADGSLGTTAGDPSVVAGTAISSTEIIVKG